MRQKGNASIRNLPEDMSQENYLKAVDEWNATEHGKSVTESGEEYHTDMLTVYFTPECSVERAREIVRDTGGIWRTGNLFVDGTICVSVALPEGTDAKEAKAQLSSMSEVEYALLVTTGQMQVMDTHEPDYPTG